MIYQSSTYLRGMVRVTGSSTMNLGFGSADPIMYKSSHCKEVSLGTHVPLCK